VHRHLCSDVDILVPFEPEAGIRISMDGQGSALDNVFTERLGRYFAHVVVLTMGVALLHPKF
jgi:sugar/nucleoside kinase (ribokinase family)